MILGVLSSVLGSHILAYKKSHENGKFRFKTGQLVGCQKFYHQRRIKGEEFGAQLVGCQKFYHQRRIKERETDGISPI